MADTTGPARRAVLAAVVVAATAAAGLAQGPPAGFPLPPPAPVPAAPADALTDGAWPFDPPAPAAPYKPFPGSAADQFARDYAARDQLRYCWGGTDLAFLPSTLLWEPPFANAREPRMMLLPTTLDNYDQTWTLDTSIGTTLGLVRGIPAWSPALEWQIDLFGVVHTRLSPEDLIAADYRFGFPVSARYGPWHAKFGYEHTSAHVGDEGIITGGLPVNSFAKDELVAGVGRWFEDCFRLYGQVSYAFFQDLPDESVDRWRFDVGFELYDRRPTGLRGTPFVAANADFRGDQDYKGNFNVQAGWLWRNPEARLALARVFVGYYTGRSPYGQFLLQREQFFAAGLAFDY